MSLCPLWLLLVRVVDVHRQSGCAHSKDWRCRARVTVVRSPYLALACVPRLRQRQSLLRTLLSQKPKPYIRHAYLLTIVSTGVRPWDEIIWLAPCYFVMESLHGSSLREKGGRCHWANAVSISRPFCARICIAFLVLLLALVELPPGT